jgi:carbamate kinase
MRTVVALGGNALAGPGRLGTAAEQLSRLRGVARALAPLLAGDEIVVTHGNGPQVGAMLVRHECAAGEVPPHPLHLIVAQTQAELGSQIAEALREVTNRPIACILTHVLVSEGDPAFREPTKPIGPIYGEPAARALERDRGWRLAAENGHWRRIVPSPRPREIVELAAIRALVADGAIAVACGGGGIPVVRRNGRLDGIDGVIDKDRASSLLAMGLGARRLLILTDVDALYRGYGEPGAEAVRELDANAAEAMLAELPAGSMRPKLESCLEFARATGGEALITSAEELERALAGRAGTRITA